MKTTCIIISSYNKAERVIELGDATFADADSLLERAFEQGQNCVNPVAGCPSASVGDLFVLQFATEGTETELLYLCDSEGFIAITGWEASFWGLKTDPLLNPPNAHGPASLIRCSPRRFVEVDCRAARAAMLARQAAEIAERRAARA